MLINPCYLNIFGNCKQNQIKLKLKEESINYLPFSISYYSPKVLKVQNSKRNKYFIYLLSHILLDPDPQHWLSGPENPTFFTHGGNSTGYRKL